MILAKVIYTESNTSFRCDWMRVSYLFCWWFLFLLSQISTVASSKTVTRRRSMLPQRPAAIGIIGRFVGLGSVWLLLLASGVVGSGEYEMVIGMHIGLQRTQNNHQRQSSELHWLLLMVLSVPIVAIVIVKQCCSYHQSWSFLPGRWLAQYCCWHRTQASFL